jgi:hypothetical protein
MIIRLWHGEIGLLRTFWLFGMGGGLLFVLPLFAMMLALTDVPDNVTASIFLAALGLLAIYLVWVFVGIWRAANKYSGNPVWAILAKIAVGMGILNIAVLVIGVLFADTS